MTDDDVAVVVVIHVTPLPPKKKKKKKKKSGSRYTTEMLRKIGTPRTVLVSQYYSLARLLGVFEFSPDSESPPLRAASPATVLLHGFQPIFSEIIQSGDCGSQGLSSCSDESSDESLTH